MEDSVIAKLAAGQRGVVTTRQLHGAGFDAAAIRRRCRGGRLHRLHRGVYLVGHTAAPAGALEVAALLACGPGSIVSHRSAAHLWGLAQIQDPPRPVEVTVVGRDAGRHSGIHIHRGRTLGPRDVRRVDGIPATAPARTLLDLAALLPFDQLETGFADARARGLVRRGELEAMLEQTRGRRGGRVFRYLVQLHQESALTRSEAERKLLALVRAAALPMPTVNARVGRFEVDFLWQPQKVVVEVDGYAFHGDRRAFERDRERDATLAARGFVVLRVTWRQLVARREAVLARVAAALSLRS